MHSVIGLGLAAAAMEGRQRMRSRVPQMHRTQPIRRRELGLVCGSCVAEEVITMQVQVEGGMTKKMTMMAAIQRMMVMDQRRNTISSDDGSCYHFTRHPLSISSLPFATYRPTI